MKILKAVLAWLLDVGEPYDPMDLSSFPRSSKSCYDLTGDGRSSLLPFSVALRERARKT